MKHTRIQNRHWRCGGFTLGAIAAVVAFTTGCATTPKHADEAGITSPNTESVAVSDVEADRFAAEYTALIDELMDGMTAVDIKQRKAPQQQFEQVCMKAGRPGAEAERVGLCRAMTARVGTDTPKVGRVWLLRQLDRLSGSESVARLTELMNDDDDPQIRELARRALQNNSSPRAGAALRDALARADTSSWKIALINALAARGEPESVSALSALMTDADEGVAQAAISGLGDFGLRAAIAALRAYWRGDTVTHRRQAAIALIRSAGRLAARGENARAARVFLDVYLFDGDTDTRLSGLSGYAAAAGERALPKLLDVLRGQLGEEARKPAARLLQRMGGAVVTLALIEELPHAEPRMQVVLLDALAERGDTRARPLALAMLASPRAEVRVAALNLLGRLGGDSTVIILAQSAARLNGDERTAARAALARLRGEGIDDTIQRWMTSDNAGVRAELVRALAARHYSRAVAAIFDAADDSAELVRTAAMESLATYASPDDLPRLLKRLISEPGPQARQAAEDAVVAVANRIADKAARTDLLLSELENTHADAKASLLRVLGRIGGPGALTAIRAALSEQEPEVYDAAVRALAGWADAAVLDDLATIAQHAATLTHRVLALRGYVRLIRLPNERPALETLAALQMAMDWAEQPAEKKLVLSGVADVIHLDALALAESHLTDAELRDEAATTMLSIAGSLAPLHRNESLAAIEEVLALDGADALHRRANDVKKNIDRFTGFIVTWRVSGPYFRDDLKADQILTTPFAPEQGDGGEAEWRDLPISTPQRPWEFDLDRSIGGSNRCVYVKAEAFSQTEQPAMLVLGSDDGIKVWLNGEVVHKNNVFRGLAIGHDQPKVTLKKGWNRLMLKISNGGGGWGFGCGVKAVDGANIEGLKFRVE